jgi:hypothetical protein
VPNWAPTPTLGPNRPFAAETEAEALQSEADWLKERLEAITRRIEELEGED